MKMKIQKKKPSKGENLHLTSEMSEFSQTKKKFPMKKKMIKEEILEKKTKKLTLQRAKKILNSRKMHKDKMESKQKEKKFKKKENTLNKTIVKRKRGDTCCAARTHVNVTPKRLYRGGWYECYQPSSYCPNQGPTIYWSNNDIIDHNSAGTSRDSESSTEDKATSVVDVTGPYTVPRLQMLESSPYINTLMPHGLSHISSVCQVCNCAHSSMMQAAQCQTFTLGGVGSLSNVQVLPPYSVSGAFTCPPPPRSSFPHCSCPTCCTAGGYYSNSGTPIIHDPIVLHHPVPLQLSHTEPGIQNIVKSDHSEYVDVVDSQSDDSKLSVISSMKSTSCDLKKAFKTVKPKDPNKIKAIKSKNEKMKDAQKNIKSKKSKKNSKEIVKTKLKKSKDKVKDLELQKTEHIKEENEQNSESQNSENNGNSEKEMEIVKERTKRKKSRGNEDDIDKKMKAKKKVLAHGWKWYGEPEIRTIKKPDGQTVTRKCYPAIKHDKDDIIQVRDCVLVCSGPRPKDIPYVAKINNFWEEVDNGEMMMTLLWYYRPEHTEAGRKPQHLENELFACRHWDETTLACIEDKGYVLTYNEYCRLVGRLFCFSMKWELNKFTKNI
ncbi:hypothetical protein CHS0354_025867 [Potamilus streckersoni]|uniref:BAH domain-containing protein n=1 Tax=Potamilus streckersoni TaxID=2493646 RepID=A0AAE0VSU9_9BIVA|nr:hypothetical protein CHS0354_025867 [Potamilus streckersoni]